ncbi:hypothetical protein L227DRAFT_611164 [Lentinus tigrinus ALCF2SS1-6]|uniref:Uncharacterized protein n=1 Tax=Lentinus tigrinus ALCF2SS1-6 TaxID=1328759 RepID=A0A5C2S9Z9_9APHY|nr:hypothetical protein L227DRAFT_611164 [Lentinus tigrinus ALCF2SS1-6]
MAPNDTAALEEQIRRATEQLCIAREREEEEKRRLEEETRKAVEKARKKEEERKRKKEEEKKRPRMAAMAERLVLVVHRLRPREGGKKKPRVEPIIVDDDDDNDGNAPGLSKPRSKGKGKEKEKSASASETPPTKKRPAPESEAPPPRKKKIGLQPLQWADEGPSTDHEERRLQERTWTLEEELRALDRKDLLVRSVLEVALLREVIAPLRREI